MVRFMVPASLVLSGCSSAFAGIWWVEQAVVTTGEDCTLTISDNFTEGQPPDDGTVTTDWTFSQTLDASPTGFFIEVLDGRGNQAFVVVNDEVYPATIDGGTLTATWTDFLDDLSSDSHVSGYTYEANISITTTNTVTLTIDGGVGSGSAAYDEHVDSTWSETDEWDAGTVGFGGGQTPAFLYLEGVGVSNDSATEDCTSANCTLEVASDCSLSAAVTAHPVVAGDEAYEGLEDAGQDPGILLAY